MSTTIRVWVWNYFLQKWQIFREYHHGSTLSYVKAAINRERTNARNMRDFWPGIDVRRVCFAFEKARSMALEVVA